MPSNDSPRVIVKFSAAYADTNKLPYDERIEQHPEQYFGKNWIDLIARFPGLKIERIFISLTPQQLIDIVKDAKIKGAQHHRTYPYPENHFLTYFRVRVLPQINHEEVIEVLRAWKNIERAYKEEEVSLPSVTRPGTTGENILANQRYLGPPPEGINAVCAWKIVGADGGNDIGLDLRFADIEQGWNLNHSDLPSGIQSLGGSMGTADHIDHGTLVLGIVLAVPNDFGCVGITPNVSRVMVKSCHPGYEGDVADAITAVTPADDTKLRSGDVLLLEGQLGDSYLPLEANGSLREFIYTTTFRDITVVEAAGNAGEDLDTYGSIMPRDSEHDSGAIMVGAASSRVPHTRNTASNYGSRIDCYAWGDSVYSTSGTGNYGTLGETSAAAAIIAGVALSIQGIAQRLQKGDLPNHRFSHTRLRDILRLNGTSSRNPASEKIGVMPDLRRIVFSEFKIDCSKPVRPPGVTGEGPLFVEYR